MTLPDVPADATFSEASEQVLAFLHEHAPLGFWAVTRTADQRQTYLSVLDHVYGLERGGSHAWQDSYCRHMAAGTAPAVAPVARAVPQYAAAAVNDLVDIGAYAGARIDEPDGTLFGALCGLHPTAVRDLLPTVGPHLAGLGRVLSRALAADRARDTARFATALGPDLLAGVVSAQTWDRVLTVEAERASRLAQPTAVIVARLRTPDRHRSAPSDPRALGLLTEALRATAAARDVAAALGSSMAGLLLRDCEEIEARACVQEVGVRLAALGVSAAVGWAPVDVRGGLLTAVAHADAASYLTPLRQPGLLVPRQRSADRVPSWEPQPA